jgi:hypothetical protein
MHLSDGGEHEFSPQVSLGVRRPGLGRGGRAGDGRPPRETVIAYRVPELWADVNVVGSPDVERLRNTLRSQHEDKVPRRGR